MGREALENLTGDGTCVQLLRAHFISECDICLKHERVRSDDPPSWVMQLRCNSCQWKVKVWRRCSWHAGRRRWNTSKLYRSESLNLQRVNRIICVILSLNYDVNHLHTPPSVCFLSPRYLPHLAGFCAGLWTILWRRWGRRTRELQRTRRKQMPWQRR